MNKWVIKYEVNVGSEDEPDYDCESQWIYSEKRPTKDEAAAELRISPSDICIIEKI